MKIRVLDDPDRLAKRVRVEFRDPNGEQHYIESLVGEHLLMNSRGALEQTIKHLKRAAMDQIERIVDNTPAIQGGEQQMATTAWYGDTNTAMWNMTYPVDISNVGATTSTTTIGTWPDDTNANYYTYPIDGMQNAQGQLNEINNQVSREVLIQIKYPDGKRKLTVTKKVAFGALDNIEITEEDIQNARMAWWKEAKFQVCVKKAESKAEDLLRMFVSEVDFREYKEKGYFTIKSGNQVFRIYKDSHKHVEMWEKGEGDLYLPKSRLCVHTPTREIPAADEALTKLMLIRSGRILEASNPHFGGDLPKLKESELVLAQ